MQNPGSNRGGAAQSRVKAPQRLPFWLIGLGLASFVAYFGLVTLVPLLL